MHWAALSRHASARRGAPCEACGSTGNCESTRRPTRGVPIARVGDGARAEPERPSGGSLRGSCCTNPTPAARVRRSACSSTSAAHRPVLPVTRRDPARCELALGPADRRFAAADWCARLNQLAGGLALCVLPSKNGNRGDSTERAAHGPGLAAGAGFRGTMVRSLEKAGADIKLVTVATLRSTRRQRRRAAGDAGRPRRLRGAATIGVALRNRG